MPFAPPDGLSEASDAELLRRVAERRDRAAFVVLFDRFAARVKAFMMRGGASAADADEIAQDVMVLVWRRAETFDPARAAASTWIFTIARNRRIDVLRRTLRPAPDPEDPLFQPEPEPDAGLRIDAEEREIRIRALLGELAAEQREVLVAAFYDGLSHAEIAARLDLPLGTVKSRIRLAFRHLRGALGESLTKELSDD
jgi:RNA polymerase sigma-70 factor (ECF subfamily)